MNCGIADADNLAWKLAAVHHGWAGGSPPSTCSGRGRPCSPHRPGRPGPTRQPRSPPNDGCRCAHPVGPDVLRGPDNSFTSVFDVTAFGVVSVRPDGHVGWRSRHTHPTSPRRSS
ncbi:FAD-dependent monooxygenase [Polymorphospora sp. NPDC051019]|uniref:FAD-dependent monooxygenase n=1 Tax=Polymorphospora sp. NPDC051019 TaxID=3155725 RepID=UPI00343C4D75